MPRYINDYISRTEALEKIDGYFGDLPIVVHYDMLKIISDLPSADVTDRKFGEWIDDEMVCKARCSACDTEWSWISNEMDRFNYCPNCGARMKGEDDGEIH